MAYCINPRCNQRKNNSAAEICSGCGGPLQVRGRYRLVSPLRPLNEPGNAEVFEVEDLQWDPLRGDRYKVMKVVSKRVKAVSVQLLQQEAEILQNLDHEGLPKIEPEDGYFSISLPQLRKPLHCLVRQKVPGKTLETLVEQQGPVEPQRVLIWLRQLLEILDYIHQHHYFHRDLKPSNIILRPDGQLVLIDGTVREVSQTIVERLMGKDVPGMGIFSPGYTAPEQESGQSVPQSDLYALGRTLVFLLTGKPPRDLREHAGSKALLWRDEAFLVSEPLARWVDYLMEPDFWNRPPNAAFVLNQLRAGLSMPPVRRSRSEPLWPKLLNLVLFSVLLVMALLWIQRWRNSQPQERQNVAVDLNYPDSSNRLVSIAAARISAPGSAPCNTSLKCSCKIRDARA